VCSEVQDVHEE